jgi:electron transport complex protein RnfC
MTIFIKSNSSFRGGVHPPENKHLTEESKIQAGPTVKEVAIMLSQHTGAVCQPLIKKGDVVKAGQKIGDNNAFISAPVHSPINGKVKDVTLQSHAIFGRCPAVLIEADAADNPVKKPSSAQFGADFDAEAFVPAKIRDAVRVAGIVGMGGAGFPTRVKIEPNPTMPERTLIINGCECEPYITCDYRVMMEWTYQVIAGVKLARRASECSQVVIAIEDNKPQAIEAIQAALKNSRDGADIKVIIVKTKYPQGGERQLINAVLKKIVPTGSIPPKIGVVVLNVATSAAIAEAVVCNRPLTHRVITVTGGGIAKTGNFYVPIGTQVGELIEFCGGATADAAKVILGGPMMGIAIADLSTPVTKTSGAITVLTRKHLERSRFGGVETPCIRCGRCLDACPENLMPTKIAHAVKYNLLDLAKDYFMSACIECGCCSYVCPANIELTGLIKTGKILAARQAKRMPQ